MRQRPRRWRRLASDEGGRRRANSKLMSTHHGSVTSHSSQGRHVTPPRIQNTTSKFLTSLLEFTFFFAAYALTIELCYSSPAMAPRAISSALAALFLASTAFAECPLTANEIEHVDFRYAAARCVRTGKGEGDKV